MITGDRMWRMPLLKYYSKQVTKADLADVDNVGKKKGEAGSCTAAAFLQVRVASVDPFILPEMDACTIFKTLNPDFFQKDQFLLKFNLDFKNTGCFFTPSVLNFSSP